MADKITQRPWRAVLVGAIALLLLVAVTIVLVQPVDGPDGSATGTGSPSPGPGATSVVVGGHPLLDEVAPEIDLQALDGGRVVLSGLRGRPVLVNFWATWCIPCRDEFPLLVTAYREHGGEEGLEILGIVHDDSAAGARRFAEDLGATWPMLLDPDDEAWDDYVGVGMPTSFFIDAEGVIRAFSLGGFTESGLAAQLGEILR